MGTFIVAIELAAAVAWFFILKVIVARHDRRRFDRTLGEAEALARGLDGDDLRSRRARVELAVVLGQVTTDYGLLGQGDRRQYGGRVAQILAASNGIDRPPAGR
jgi:hypothetical protein